MNIQLYTMMKWVRACLGMGTRPHYVRNKWCPANNGCFRSCTHSTLHPCTYIGTCLTRNGENSAMIRLAELGLSISTSQGRCFRLGIAQKVFYSSGKPNIPVIRSLGQLRRWRQEARDRKLSVGVVPTVRIIIIHFEHSGSVTHRLIPCFRWERCMKDI